MEVCFMIKSIKKTLFFLTSATITAACGAPHKRMADYQRSTLNTFSSSLHADAPAQGTSGFPTNITRFKDNPEYIVTTACSDLDCLQESFKEDEIFLREKLDTAQSISPHLPFGPTERITRQECSRRFSSEVQPNYRNNLLQSGVSGTLTLATDIPCDPYILFKPHYFYDDVRSLGKKTALGINVVYILGVIDRGVGPDGEDKPQVALLDENKRILEIVSGKNHDGGLLVTSIDSNNDMYIANRPVGAPVNKYMKFIESNGLRSAEIDTWNSITVYRFRRITHDYWYTYEMLQTFRKGQYYGWTPAERANEDILIRGYKNGIEICRAGFIKRNGQKLILPSGEEFLKCNLKGLPYE